MFDHDFLDIVKTQVETEIEPNSPFDDIWMEAIARISGGFHRVCLTECPDMVINVTKPYMDISMSYSSSIS